MTIDADEIADDASAALGSGSDDHLGAMRHSAAHMVAAAVLELFPDARLGIGPAIKDGFYYDFDLPRPLTPADLEEVEALMREQQAAALAFEHSKDLPRADAVAELTAKGQPFKVEIVNDLPESDGPTVSFYRHGTFEDLCRGRHLASTRDLGAFKLLNTAGAYWRGDETPTDAPAHLRDGLGHPGGAGSPPVAPRGGEEARPPQARTRARPLHLPPRIAGRAVPRMPRGMALWRALEDWSREVRTRRRFQRGEDSEPRPQGAVGDLGPLGPTTRTTCSSSTTTSTSRA